MSDSSSGVVVGVVISVAVVVIIFVAVGVWWWLRKKRRARGRRNTSQATKLDEVFHNVAFTNTENPPPPKPPNVNLAAPPGGPGTGYAPNSATRQSNAMAAPPPAASANQSGYSYKATKPQYTAPPPTAPSAAAAAPTAPASSRAPARAHQHQPAVARGAEPTASRPAATGGVGVEVNRSGGQASKDSGLASTSLHSGGSIDDEEVAPYSMFAAGLLTDATSTSARAIIPSQEQAQVGGTMGARQVALAANGSASKLTLGENTQSYSPTIGKRPPGMSPPQSYMSMEKVMPPGPASVPVYYAVPVPVKRPYGYTGVDTRPDPYAAARRATVERLSARAKRVKQLNSDLDSSSPEMDGGGSVSMTFDASVASSTDVSKASNNFDFEDPENRGGPSKKVRFTTPEEPEKPHRRQLSARYRGRAPPGRFPGLNAQQAAAAAAAGLGDAFIRIGSSERRRRDGRPPTGRQATPNSSVDYATMRGNSINSLDSSLVTGSSSAVNTSLPESRQPPPLESQPKKSILRVSSSESLNRSRDSRRRRAASDDGSLNASRSSFGRAASADVESARVPLSSTAKRATSPPEVYMATEAPKPAGRKPATKHLPAGSPTSTNAPTTLSPTSQQPSIESDV